MRSLRLLAGLALVMLTVGCDLQEAPFPRLPAPDSCDDPNRVSPDQCTRSDAVASAESSTGLVFFANILAGDVGDECSEFSCRERPFESVVVALEAEVPETVGDAVEWLAALEPAADWVSSDAGGDVMPLLSVPALACLRDNPTCTTCVIITDAPRSVGLIQGLSFEPFTRVNPASAGVSGTYCFDDDDNDGGVE